MLYRAIFLIIALHMADGHTNVRLVHGPTPSEGRVELYRDGSWGAICGEGWGMMEAAVTCRMLHYDNASEIYVSKLFGQGGETVWIKHVQCDGTEGSIDDCQQVPLMATDNCPNSEVAGVKCFPGVRLVGGSSVLEGRVEIYHNGTWGTICDSGWDLDDAGVLCKSLGYEGASDAPHGAHFGAGSGPIWLGNLDCTGNEAHIRDCTASEWGSSGCDHTADASAVCQPRATFRAYSGVVEYVCGDERLSRYHEVNCSSASGKVAMFVDMTVNIPTTIGYNNTVQGLIMQCVEPEVCKEDCYTMHNTTEFVVQWCNTSCCSYDYCNYPRSNSYEHYYRPVPNPENIVTEADSLLTLHVEIFPNCIFRDIWAKMVPCGQHIFDLWPFDSASDCETSFVNAMLCELETMYACQSDEPYTSAMWPLPTHYNLTELVREIRESGSLDLVCHTPLDQLYDFAFGLTLDGANETDDTSSSYSSGPVSGFDGTFGWLLLMCDHFTLSSIFEWLVDLVPAFRGTDKVAMCRTLKGTVNKIIHAGRTRCNVDALASHLPCDSVLWNQYRAFLVQVLDELPVVAPDFCRDVEPPDEEDDRVEDIPFLARCTLRETIDSMWVCERRFTKPTPYTDSDTCRNNVNSFLHCVANRLQQCADGPGRNVLEELFPHLTFAQMLSTIRRQAKTHSEDILSMVCSNADISSWQFALNSSLISSACQGGVFMEIAEKFQQTYYQYAGAIYSADVCMAFKELRDWMNETITNRCNLYLLRYLAPHYSLFDVISNALQIATDVLPGLTISSCPEMFVSSGNGSFTATDWLRSYIRWRMHSLPAWKRDFEDWSNSCGMTEAVQIPPCVNLTNIRCRNAAMKACETDVYGCTFCHCLDHKYTGVNAAVMEPWKQDWEKWEEFHEKWEEGWTTWRDTDGC